MSFGFNIRKANGANSYESGDKSLHYVGKINLNVGTTFYPTNEDRGWRNVRHGSGLYNTYDHIQSNGARRPFFARLIDTSRSADSIFTQYGVENLVLFVKPLSGMRFGVSLSRSGSRRVLGLLLEGIVRSGVIEIFVFTGITFSLDQVNSGYGINIFDERGDPIYSTNYLDLSIIGSGFISCPSFSISNSSGSNSYAVTTRQTVSSTNFSLTRAYNLTPFFVSYTIFTMQLDPYLDPLELVSCLGEVRNGSLRVRSRTALISPFPRKIDVPSTNIPYTVIDPVKYNAFDVPVRNLTIEDFGPTRGS